MSLENESRLVPPLQRPSAEELIALGDLDFLGLDAPEAEDLGVIVDELLGVVEELTVLWSERDAPLPVPERWGGRSPGKGENPLNAFVWLCDIEGASAGPLSGRLIGVKDNIDVAQIPTTNGSALNPYTATVDATVIERVLEAGGHIVGKLNLDNYSSGGSGETSVFGPPLNPVNPKHSAGGSSGGSGAALAAGAVDLALGVDQAGSARIPASYCGTLALKATHGTVPTYGVTHLDHTLDAICPMARSVDDVELLYAAIAGPDWRDPQWLPEREESATSRDPAAASSGADGVTGLRFAVVREGIDAEVCSPDVLTEFDRSTDALRAGGATVETISIPLWPYGYPIARPLLCHLVQGILFSEGEGYGHFGLVDLARMRTFAANRRLKGSLFPPNTKVWMLTGRYLQERYLSASFGVAQNLRLALREDIKKALSSFDCLLTPTTPFTAPLLETSELSASELVRQSRPQIAYNTAPANLSGHPALAVPNGADASGLPTSVQLVGAYFAEPLLFRIARFLEQMNERGRADEDRIAAARAATIRSVSTHEG
jgi:amidase